MKKIKEIHALIKDSEFSTKIKLFFGARTYSDSYDPETNNYSTTFRNPITIKGLVRHLTPESTIWKVYGTYTDGAVEIITSKKFTQNFRDCQKITIDDIEYSVLRSKVGSNASIQPRPNDLIRVSLKRV